MHEFGVTYILPSLSATPPVQPPPSLELQNAISATSAAWVAARAGQVAAGFSGLTFLVALVAAIQAIRVWKPEVIGRASHAALLTAQKELLNIKQSISDFMERGARVDPAPIAVKRSYDDTMTAFDSLERALIPVLPKWSAYEKRTYAEFRAEISKITNLKEEFDKVNFGGARRSSKPNGETDTFYTGLNNVEEKEKLRIISEKIKEFSINETWISVINDMQQLIDKKIENF